MQRAKHAERKQRTRHLILMGAAAERAGAADLDPSVIETVLRHFMETGGEPRLKAAVDSCEQSAPGDAIAGQTRSINEA
jgi:hypothetical protein